MRSRRSQSDLQHLGGLLDCQFLVEDQVQHIALPYRQRSQRAAELTVALATAEGFLRRGYRNQWLSAPLRQEQLPDPSPPALFPGGTAYNAEKPRPQAGAAAESCRA